MLLVASYRQKPDLVAGPMSQPVGQDLAFQYIATNIEVNHNLSTKTGSPLLNYSLRLYERQKNVKQTIFSGLAY